MIKIEYCDGKIEEVVRSVGDHPHNDVHLFTLSSGVQPRKNLPRMTAITYSVKQEYRNSIQAFASKHPDKYRLMEGRFIQDIPADEVGKADLITDVYCTGRFITQTIRTRSCRSISNSSMKAATFSYRFRPLT